MTAESHPDSDSPTVQFGLDLQYSFTGLFCLGPRSAGIHRRPPGFPVPCCSSCCLPSPYKRLSRSPTTTEAPPLAKSFSGPRAARSRISFMTDGLGSVPTFTMNRSTGMVPSFSPATSPWIRRRPSPRPPLRWLLHLHRVAVGLQPATCVAIPAPIHQVWAGGPLKGISPLVHFRLHLSVLLARRRAVWWCPSALSLSRLLPPSPALPGSGCLQLQRAAATARRWVLASHPVLWRLVEHQGVRPQVNVASCAQVALRPTLVFLLPDLLEAHDVGRRQAPCIFNKWA